ncbi:hypothetical protein MUK42_36486 [Musa troglodytarum]|uniref:Uncharacterized protein n=1 Tax=Musa troglodytarum TaxID=320322 RepID=A0A9E7JYR0_9LILI|nr:hypothetical protein MUK42_36486 [Musa troglodytarum]
MLLGVMLSVKAPHSTSFLIQEYFIKDGRIDSLRFLLASSCARKPPWACTRAGCLPLGGFGA